MTTPEARRATTEEADTVARLLHDFNTEFDTPSPGVAALAARLRTLLSAPQTFALLVGEPAVGVGLVTMRPNVWYDGEVALLDELYVVPDRRGEGLGTLLIDRLFAETHALGASAIEINVDADDVDAQRFYERHGFSGVDPDTGERAFFYYREL
jgi:GNAT superfamily N-acetyltransferase